GGFSGPAASEAASVGGVATCGPFGQRSTLAIRQRSFKIRVAVRGHVGRYAIGRHVVRRRRDIVRRRWGDIVRRRWRNIVRGRRDVRRGRDVVRRPVAWHVVRRRRVVAVVVIQRPVV